MNILGLLVVYDPERYRSAEKTFRDLLNECSTQHSLSICSNNPRLMVGDVIGSNSAAEFSGWDEAARRYDITKFDLILLANDTFCTRREFSNADMNRFCRLAMKAAESHRNFIVGEVSFSINYRRMIKARRFLLRWVRTSIFAISPATFTAIHGVGIDTSVLNHLVTINPDSSLHYGESIHPLIKERINNWLFSKDEKKGWYKARSASINLLRLKAQCVLQELELSIRCEKNCAIFIPLNRISWPRRIILNSLYRLQYLLPR